MRRLSFLPAGVALATLACGAPNAASSGPAKVDLPATDGLPSKAPPRTRQSPPPSGAARGAPFPHVERTRLANGLEVTVVTARALPIVQVRLVVKAGSSYGALPGTGALTARMLKDGGTRSTASAEVLRRVETLGADLSTSATRDAVVLGIGLTADELGPGLALLSEIVREPRFDAGELARTKARAVDEAESAARSSGIWAAARIAWSHLYPEGSPYHVLSLVPSQIAKIDRARVRDFHRRFFVPKNATLVVVGDVDGASANELAERHFGAWTGAEPPRVELPRPSAPDGARVLVAHRPKSVQSDVLVATLAPERDSRRWAAIRIATHALGGGPASRLFDDVRERRSLAYTTSAQISEVAHGEQPLFVHANTESSKTAETVKLLLDHVERMRTSPPTAEETASARRYLGDVFAIRMETIGAIADLIATQESLHLPDGHWDAYRRSLGETTPEEIAEAVPSLFSRRPLVVVAGDADVIGADLARFGDVDVLDPEKDFTKIRTIARTAN